ncbi:hypothetical protein Scep_021316 [Stephania cephalantha]|uniref:Uncharacterized protein n=1 Tax=Stephania cephalantha TaxID=152367 RepID=A0AAP0I047_9MAGN
MHTKTNSHTPSPSLSPHTHTLAHTHTHREAESGKKERKGGGEGGTLREGEEEVETSTVEELKRSQSGVGRVSRDVSETSECVLRYVRFHLKVTEGLLFHR